MNPGQAPLRIALVGLPGCGKSTVGRHLARRLNLPFLDSDHEFERQMGCSIREFFEHAGQDRFREVEQNLIDQLTQGDSCVLATGGGAVLRSINREHLHGRTKVVYLHSPPEELTRRLRHDQNRPLLQVADPAAKLVELYAERDPLYREVAHLVIEIGRPSVSGLVSAVLLKLELAGVLRRQ